MEVGDIVSIRASRCETSCCPPASWFINNSVGLLVLHPDMLISSTAVVGSLFCLRRGVLSEWFRGIDRDSRIMIIGSLVHELLQEVIYIFLFNFILWCIFRLSALELWNDCILNSYDL
jgi:DNA replication ATP-dependent helicase Dna2